MQWNFAISRSTNSLLSHVCIHSLIPTAVLPIGEARANLVKSLSEDISQLETSNSWIEEYVQANGYTVKTNVETQGVVAIRKNEGYEIRATFRATDYTEPDAENQPENSDFEEPINEHAFFVDITAPNGKILRVDCANAPDAELVIHGISFPDTVSDDPTAADAPIRSNDEEAPMTEGALDFHDLEPASQENLLDLFESLGVDDDLALFVATQAQIVRSLNLQKDLTNLKTFLQ